jgi:hypothetical protein
MPPRTSLDLLPNTGLSLRVAAQQDWYAWPTIQVARAGHGRRVLEVEATLGRRHVHGRFHERLGRQLKVGG